MPDVSVLIVCYNSRALIEQCLSSLNRASQGIGFEVLLTDNSDDGTTELVKAAYPQVRLIESGRNRGFAGGCNLLATHATGELILLLNPDTIVEASAIQNLLHFAREWPDAGAWGGITRLPDGRIDPGCMQARTGLGSALRYAMGLGDRHAHSGRATDGPRSVHTLSGAFMMVPAKVWREVGGMDESFFMYSEEADLCYRIRETGRRIYQTPAARVIHLVGGGAGNSQRVSRMMRGRMHFMWKHAGPSRAVLMGLITWCHAMSRCALGVLGAPLIGKERAAVLRSEFAPIVRRPSGWWFGWRNHAL